MKNIQKQSLNSCAIKAEAVILKKMKLKDPLQTPFKLQTTDVVVASACSNICQHCHRFYQEKHQQHNEQNHHHQQQQQQQNQQKYQHHQHQQHLRYRQSTVTVTTTKTKTSASTIYWIKNLHFIWFGKCNNTINNFANATLYFFYYYYVFFISLRP